MSDIKKREMRINRFLANCGLCSRRNAEKLVESGRVTVNGNVCTDLTVNIKVGTDIVLLDNKQVDLKEEKIYLLLNKPRGYIVSRKDEFSRKTVYKLIPEEWNHLFPVGRLDKDSEGLLLMTNDGVFAQKIIHPSFELAKVYRVSIKGALKKEDLRLLRQGLDLDGVCTLPAKLYIKSQTDEKCVIRMTLYEGRNRQIRRMFEQLGYTVISLKRLQVGNIKLDKVPVGMFRLLRPSEVTAIMSRDKLYRKQT